MASLAELMSQVRKLRDALHDRLDDPVSDKVFTSLRLRHAEAVVQARRELEDPSLAANSAAYDSMGRDLSAASTAVSAAKATDEAQMLSAIWQAGDALDRVERLP